MTSYNHFNYFAWVGYICIDQVGNLAIISRLLESESMPSNSARFRELVDRVIRSFFRVEVEMGGFWVVVLGVESASYLARRAGSMSCSLSWPSTIGRCTVFSCDEEMS